MLKPESLSSGKERKLDGKSFFGLRNMLTDAICNLQITMQEMCSGPVEKFRDPVVIFFYLVSSILPCIAYVRYLCKRLFLTEIMTHYIVMFLIGIRLRQR